MVRDVPGEVGDIRVEGVADDGTVTVIYPGGWQGRFRVSQEMVPYYRRLVGGGSIGS